MSLPPYSPVHPTPRVNKLAVKVFEKVKGGGTCRTALPDRHWPFGLIAQRTDVGGDGVIIATVIKKQSSRRSGSQDGCW